MTQEMINTLDKFFAERTIMDIDRNTFLMCNLYDRPKKITISLVFMRDWDSIETDSFNSVIIQDKGAVFTFPCYWIEIPKELAMTYIMYIIDDFYQNEVSKWSSNSSGGNTSGSGNDCNCPCNIV